MSELAETKSSEKSALEEVLNKMVVENDSLKRKIVFLDSLFRAEKEKNNAVVANKREDRGLNLKPKAAVISGKEEYDKKAIFMYSFISYISWPADNTVSTFNIGIIGESPLKNSLAAYVYSKTVNKLPIVVETYQPGKNYKILFFSSEGQAQFSKVRKKVNKEEVLLITENPNLEKIGSHITLFLDGPKVKFSANKPALEKTKLKVSNSLYSLSD